MNRHGNRRKILNVRLPADLHGQLEQLLQATGRTKSFLTIEALKSYVSQEQGLRMAAVRMCRRCANSTASTLKDKV